MQVLIAGGGIAGVTMGLTLHQIGVPFKIFESIKEPKPLGVGINLQPPAVRELYDLGLASLLEKLGVQTKDYGFYTKTGVEIWTEPRGKFAGYHWPQYSVHRGQLQIALLEELIKRCGDDCIEFGCGAKSFSFNPNGVELHYESNGVSHSIEGSMLIGADGIHSALRVQMYPNEGPPVWGGAIMWRGTTFAQAFLSGASMILSGNDHQRFVAYPISTPDEETGKVTINWIAEKTVDPDTHLEKEDWNRRVDKDRFIHDFKDWDFGWINVPALINNANDIFEYPMIDREPVSSWTDKTVTLIGDAAHATYPVGSSGASQAILDARYLGSEIQKHGLSAKAAIEYENRILPMANNVTMANRGKGGPDAIMQMAEDRCGEDFSNLDEMLPYDERRAHAENFKRLAKISVEDTNRQQGIITLK